MEATITLHVGRLHSRPDGYEIRLPDGEVVLGPRGEGLTLAEAEFVLDLIELRNQNGGRESRNAILDQKTLGLTSRRSGETQRAFETNGVSNVSKPPRR